MAFNSSHFLSGSWCSFLAFPNGSETSFYYKVTLTTCVVSSLLAPMAVVANALILAAIWNYPSLRTPSYVLLAGLAFTDFFTGLVTQPFYVVYKLGELTESREMFCIGGIVSGSAGYYFSSLTGTMMTIIAVERWLHMSRRSLLTVRRVVTLYITCLVALLLFFAGHIYYWSYTKEFFSVFIILLLLWAAFYFSLTLFAYFKVFQIIRHHQSQVQTNQNAIDIKKYKKSVFTILYILVLFLLSYAPFLVCILVVSIVDFRSISWNGILNVCATIILSSSVLNPLLYYWRIKEIRNSVRAILRNLCCKQYEQEWLQFPIQRHLRIRICWWVMMTTSQIVKKEINKIKIIFIKEDFSDPIMFFLNKAYLILKRAIISSYRKL